MAIARTITQLSIPDDGQETASKVAREAILRGIGALVLFSVGTIHFLQIVGTFSQTPLLGVSYLVLIAASLGVAVRLLAGGDDRTWAAAGIIGVAVIAGYVFTRLLKTPLDNQDVGNWSCMLGLASLFVEAALVALSAYAMRARRIGAI